jgi:integrase
VLKIYLDDVVPGHADPEQSAGRCLRLNEFFGAMTLDQINGKVCREYAASRVGKGKTTKGTTGGARRDLEALRAAINHHWKEGLHREKIRIVMPKKGKARQRWLTRLEFARLLRVCWSTREIVDGKPTKKRPLLHLCRFLLLGTYTGSRPGVVMTAAWDKGPGRSWVDTDMGRFYRLPDGDVETDKRNPPVKLAPGLLSHLRRWKKIDSGRGYVVTFNGRQVESVDIALARATTLAQLESGVVAYTMRHTCGSWLVAKGVSTRKVADFLGTSEQMVIEHYGHLAPDFQDEAASKIGRK